MVYFLRHPPHAGARVLREQSLSGSGGRVARDSPPGTSEALGAVAHEPRRVKRRGRRDKHSGTGQAVAIWSAEEEEDDERPSFNDERRSSLGDLRPGHLQQQTERTIQEQYIPQQYTTQKRHLRDPGQYYRMPEQEAGQSHAATLPKPHKPPAPAPQPLAPVRIEQDYQKLQHQHLVQEQNLRKQHRIEEDLLHRQQKQEQQELLRHRQHLQQQQQQLRAQETQGYQMAYKPSTPPGHQQQQPPPPRPAPKEAQGVSTVMQAANYVLDVGRSTLPSAGLRRTATDNLDQPLLRTSNGATPPVQARAMPQPGPSQAGSFGPPQPHAGHQQPGPSGPVADRGLYVGTLSGRTQAHVPFVTGGPRRIMKGVSPSVVSTDIDGDHRSSIFSTRTPSSISFRGIEYTVKQRRWPWSKPEKKVVLSGASGIMHPGVNAIMGPTGSGKSSLLDVLAGRKDPQYLSGEVLINGDPQPSNFKCMSGYVVQDDIVIGELTVRENLWFSASLRLPARWTRKARLKKVEEVIEELSLGKVADSKIGTELIRGVSGGERKRTNIGMELITDPSVLFLDEPTTGLDAFTAGSVIKTLKNLGLRGRTIILSIHQPKYSIYKLFDSLTLVLSGHVIYHGPADDAPIQYFKKIGYEIEERNSPPDFFMDLLHGEILQNPVAMKHKYTNMAYIGDSASMSGALDGEIYPIEDDYSRVNITTNLIKSWQNSSENQRLNEELDMLCRESFSSSFGSNGDFNVGRQPAKRNRISYPTSFARQLVYVTWRSGLSLLRNPIASVVQLAVYLFFGVSIGAVYFGLDKSTESGIQNRVGLFFFLTLQMVFVNMGTVEVFIKERVAFIHENSSGFYRVSVYFIAKILVDMIPLKALPVLLFMPIVYWMAGLKPDAGAFFFYELVLVLATSAACGIAYFVSATVSVFGVASLVISMLYVFMMVFGGYLINIKSMGSWLNWCRYLSVFRYCIGSLTLNEMKGLKFTPMDKQNVNGTFKLGTEYLREQDIPHETAWDLWSNVVGILLITIFFCALTYIQLRRINKYK